ncbi:MAG: glycerol-3-phosphate 1-O-acyltransferase PlsY [Rhodospirillales bacterium]|jgi:glycerol-3-phosphate acyltransferase PlsY
MFHPDLELILLYLSASLGGYIVGSVPCGLIFTHLAGMGDVRDIGSGSIGATNVLRTGNKALAAATLLADLTKGAAAVFAFGMLGTTPGLIAGLGAVLGHNFPVWLRFSGGKGIATSFGVLLIASWPVGLLAALTWIITALLFRISSLASLLTAVAVPFYMYWLETGHHTALAMALSVLALICHRENIRRLLKGEETKIGEKG